VPTILAQASDPPPIEDIGRRGRGLFPQSRECAAVAAVRGLLQGDAVLVPDEKEANSLYNKGTYGVPQKGGALRLDLVEALYLLEADRLRVEGHHVASLLRHASARESDFEIRYIVYRDLRGRTFAVKPSAHLDYNVFPRGALPGKTPSSHVVRCATERGSFDPAAVLAELDQATRLKKRLLLALVDEEGDLTYYDVTEPELRAAVQALPAVRVKAVLLEDRVMVLDPDAARALFAEGYFGRDVGLGLQLSLPEALYLADAQRLDVEDAEGRPVLPAALAERARRLEPGFELRQRLYEQLRKAGVVVKTGFKYGTHFRAYVGPPEEEHAPYLVHALAPGRVLHWPEIAGFVRLAHGVRKRLFFAAPQGDRFRLLELARTRP
jgi:tRNA-intron endonuclease